MRYRNCIRLVAAALLLAGVPQAFAATTAGTKIDNQATVTYSVGGVEQTTEVQGETSFLVDRKIDIVVAGFGPVAIAPGITPNFANDYVLKYTVTNNTNDVIDIELLLAPEGDGATLPGGAGTDNKDTGASTYTIRVDAESGTGALPGQFDDTDYMVAAIGDPQFLNAVAAGDTVTLYVQPNEQFSDDTVLLNDDLIALQLTAVAHSAYDDDELPIAAFSVTEGATTTNYAARTLQAGLGPKLLEDTAGDNPYEVDNVYADSADTDGSGDAAENGQDDAYSWYKVVTASIAVTKKSTVYYDPVNFLANPVAIPGSMVLYCVSVKNSGASDATAVVINDDIPTGTAFVDDTSTVQDFNTEAAAVAFTNANSIRFSTAETCTAADWDAGTAETSANDAAGDGAAGTYDTSGTPKITTTVDALDGVDDEGSGTAPGVTTTMFMVEVQ